MVVALIGITGTLLAGSVTPFLLEKIRAKNLRLERITERRLDLYSDTLQVTAGVVDNLMLWSSIPQADAPEPEQEALSRLDGRLRVLASDAVNTTYRQFNGLARDFYRRLWMERMKLSAQEDADGTNEGRALMERLALGKIADEAKVAHDALQEIIRTEVHK